MHRLPAIKLSVDYWRITKTDPEGNAFGILELACEGGQNNNCQTIRCPFCSCLMSCKSSLGKVSQKIWKFFGNRIRPSEWIFLYFIRILSMLLYSLSGSESGDEILLLLFHGMTNDAHILPFRELGGVGEWIKNIFL